MPMPPPPSILWGGGVLCINLSGWRRALYVLIYSDNWKYIIISGMVSWPSSCNQLSRWGHVLIICIDLSTWQHILFMDILGWRRTLNLLIYPHAWCHALYLLIYRDDCLQFNYCYISGWPQALYLLWFRMTACILFIFIWMRACTLFNGTYRQRWNFMYWYIRMTPCTLFIYISGWCHALYLFIYPDDAIHSIYWYIRMTPCTLVINISGWWHAIYIYVDCYK